MSGSLIMAFFKSNLDSKSGLALIVADILGTAQGCRRLVRGVIAESGTTLTLATASVPANIAAKAGLATKNKPSSTFTKLTIKKSPLRDFSLRS